MIKNRLDRRSVIDKGVKYSLLGFWWTFALSLFVVVFWMFLSALKTDVAYFKDPLGIPLKDPSSWTLQNFRTVWNSMSMKVLVNGEMVMYTPTEMIIYSFLWSSLCPAINVFVVAIFSYIVAYYKFPGRNFLISLNIILMIVPIVSSLAASMNLRQKLGLYDNFWGLMLINNIQPFGFNFLLFLGLWKSIPWSYAEAAFIDGASNLQVMRRVMLPLVMPTCVALWLLGFIGSMSDYMTSITWLPSTPMFATGVYRFNLKATSFGVSPNITMAGYALLAIPCIIFFVAQRKLISEKITIGGLKG